MRFPTSQLLRSLRFGALPHRAYCAFHVKGDVQKRRSARTSQQSTASPGPPLQGRSNARRKQHRSIPLVLSDQHQHAEHGSNCMPRHISDAVHVFEYAQLLETTATRLWADLKMAQRSLSRWTARESFAFERMRMDTNYTVNVKRIQSQQNSYEARSEELCQQIRDNKSKMDLAEDLLEDIMHAIMASAISYFVHKYDTLFEVHPFDNAAFKQTLMALGCAYEAYDFQQAESQKARAAFLANTDPTLSQKRREIRERYQTARQLESACREYYKECRTRFLQHCLPDIKESDDNPGLRGYLTQHNMAIRVPENPEYRRARRWLETDRDSATGRPTLEDSAYVPAPPQVSEQTEQLYNLRHEFRRAERKYNDFVDQYNNERALQMGILLDLPENYFRDAYVAANDHTPEGRAAELREVMDTAREAYDVLRNTIQETLPPASESSLAAQPSDYIEYAGGPMSWEAEGDDRVIDWQGNAASEISALGQRDLPSEPASRYQGRSLGVGGRTVSPSVKSNYTGEREYRERRRKWLARKGKYGIA